LPSKGSSDHTGNGICGAGFYPSAAAREVEIIRVKIFTRSIFESSIYTATPILTRVRDIHPAIVTHLHLVAEDIGDAFEAVVARKAQLRALKIQIQVTRQIRKLASLGKIV